MRGFQLIEVIIAGAIFFMVCLFVLNLLPTSQWAVAQAEYRMTAENLAYSKLDELRAGSFELLQEGLHPVGSIRSSGVEFTSQFQVSAIPGADFDLVREVRVTVFWEVRGESRFVTAHSYINRIRN